MKPYWRKKKSNDSQVLWSVCTVNSYPL